MVTNLAKILKQFMVVQRHRPYPIFCSVSVHAIINLNVLVVQYVKKGLVGNFETKIWKRNR